MDRNAFKQRMQALKSYRESNPGKGYWDWKVQSFEDGGEVSREQQAIQNALNAKGTPNQFMDTWNQARLATGNFNDQLGDGKLELQKANRDATAIYKSPITYGFNSYLRGTPVMKSATMTEQEAIQRHIQDAKRFGIGTKVRMQNPDQKGLIGTQTIAGEYSPKDKTIYASTENVLTHEQAHASNAYPQENRIQEILGGQNKATTDYLDRPTEVYSRLMNFRQTNQIDPNKVWDKDSLKELRKTAIDDDLLNRYKDEQLIDIFNTVADIGTERNYDQPQYLAEGGEVGDPDDEFIQKDPDKALDRYKYLRMPTEKKSIMNQFDEYLMQNYNPSTYPTNTKQFREAIENAPDIYRNMKMLLKIHTKPSILFKDFQTRPIVRNINKKSNQEIV